MHYFCNHEISKNRSKKGEKIKKKVKSKNVQGKGKTEPEPTNSEQPTVKKLEKA